MSICHVWSALYSWSKLIFKNILKEKTYYFHFINKEIGSKKLTNLPSIMNSSGEWEIFPSFMNLELVPFSQNPSKVAGITNRSWHGREKLHKGSTLTNFTLKAYCSGVENNEKSSDIRTKNFDRYLYFL